MKVDARCEECDKIIYTSIVCDVCSKNLDVYEIGKNRPINLNYQEAEYDFCDLDCLTKFINEENNKPRRN